MRLLRTGYVPRVVAGRERTCLFNQFLQASGYSLFDSHYCPDPEKQKAPSSELPEAFETVPTLCTHEGLDGSAKCLICKDFGVS